VRPWNEGAKREFGLSATSLKGDRTHLALCLHLKEEREQTDVRGKSREMWKAKQRLKGRIVLEKRKYDRN